MKREENKNFKRSKLDIKTQLKEAFYYLKKSLKYVYFSIFIFIASGIFGFLNADRLSFIDKLLEEIISQTVGLNSLELIFFILQNNLQSSLISLVGGIFFGVFPIINAITNGAVIGYVLSKSYQIAGPSIIWRLVPHGIFELPAIFISLGLGIKLGFSIFSKNKTREFKSRFYNSANTFLMIVIPLLIIAAIIEGILIALIG